MFRYNNSRQVGKCPSHPFLIFLDPPLADAGKMSSMRDFSIVDNFFRDQKPIPAYSK